jgi:hypothetical protein
MQILADQAVNDRLPCGWAPRSTCRRITFQPKRRPYRQDLLPLIGPYRMERIGLKPARCNVTGHADVVTPSSIMGVIVVEANALQAMLEGHANEALGRRQERVMVEEVSVEGGLACGKQQPGLPVQVANRFRNGADFNQFGIQFPDDFLNFDKPNTGSVATTKTPGHDEEDLERALSPNEMSDMAARRNVLIEIDQKDCMLHR